MKFKTPGLKLNKFISRANLNTLTIFMCIIFAYIAFSHILIPATHSIYPIMLFRTGEVANSQDQYAKFFRKDSYLPNGEAYLVKRIGCIGGQYLNRQGNQFYCDGMEIALAMSRDSKGHNLSIFDFSGPIPPGKAFAVGDTTNSYDSRYWGFIDLSETERLVPLLSLVDLRMRKSTGN